MIRATSLFFLSLLGIPLFAQPALNQTSIAGFSLSENASYSTIRKLEMALHFVLQASNSFYLLQTSETDKDTTKDIKALITEADQLISSLPKQTHEQKTDSLMVTIKNVWPELKNKILSKIDPAIDPFDPFDSVSTDTYIRSIVFSMRESIKAIREQSGLDNEESLFQLSDQALRIRHINTCYSAIALQAGASNSNMDRRDLEKLTKEFEAVSQTLKDRFKDNRQVGNKIEDAYTSWKMISQAIQNTQSEPVPFLVSKYSEQVVKDLNQALFYLQR